MPEGSPSVMPMIFVDSVEDAEAYYTEKLGFSHHMGMLGEDGKLAFVNVARDGVAFMLSLAPPGMGGTGPAGDSARPVELYVPVKDVDGYFEEVKKLGAEVAEPLTDQWWGDRTFVVKDAYGYRIWFYQTVGEVVPPPGAKIV